MNTQPDQLLDIQTRLGSLERENRRMKKVMAIVILGAASVLTMGQSKPSRTIEGERIILKDSNGATRAELRMNGGFPSLDFFDSDGTLRSGLGSELLSFNNGQVMRSKFKDVADPSKGFDEEYVTGPQVTLSQYGLDVMESVKGNGSRRPFVSLSWVPGPGNPQLILQSTQGTGSILDMAASAEGPYLRIRDSQGFSSVLGSSSLVEPSTGETHKTSAASVNLFDKDRNVIWSAPARR